MGLPDPRPSTPQSLRDIDPLATRYRKEGRPPLESYRRPPPPEPRVLPLLFAFSCGALAVAGTAAIWEILK